MRNQKTVLPVLVALLLATLAFSQAQEQLQVLVTSDRTAAIRIHKAGGEEGLSGDLEAGADLAEGSAAVRADLSLEDAEELGDGTAGAFLKTTGAATETIGKVDLPLPAEDGDAPDRLDLTFVSATAGDAPYVRAELTTAAPADQPVPTVAVKGTMEGSSDALSGTLDYSVEVPEGRAGQIPVTDLSLALSDATAGSGDSETVTTTLSVSMTVPKGSQAEQQLRQLSQVSPMIEQQLKAAGFRVEKVEVPPLEETSDALTAHVTVAVRDVRGTLNGLVDAAVPDTAPDPALDPELMAASLEKMAQARIDTFALSMNVDGRTVSGHVRGRVSRVKGLLDAYMDLVRTTVERAGTAGEDSVPEESSAFVAAFQEASIDKAARSLEIAMDSDLSFAGDGELNVSSADGTATVDGELTLNVDGYRDFAEKARAEGLPVADSGLATGSLRLTDAGRLGGEYYAYTDADVPGYYKSLVLEALSRTGAAEETSSLVEEASLEEAAFSLNLEGGELKVRGYSRTTPLTRASRALLRELKPELEGTPEGAHVDYTFRPDGTGEGDLLIRFSDFMPNRSAAEIRKALGLPETAGVQMDASPDAVTLTRVERPEVQPSAQLAGVRSSARELAARGPAGEERGLPSWMLIAGGVAVVALLAVGWAVARQRASRV